MKDTNEWQQVQGIQDWPERAAAAHWCVQRLADGCGMTVTQLQRFFQETWGQCPREWLNAERMRRAGELLERRERIKDIADKLGYGHQRNFSTAFTRHFGYNPREHLLRKARDEGRGARAGEGRASHSVRAASPQAAKSEIGNRKSEIGNRKSEQGGD
jgi:AraC-like DNA-binding protein